MSPYEVFVRYSALKLHFTNQKYNYFTYNKKTKTSIDSFNKRSDKYWFEKLSRQKSESEIEEFFVANFIKSDNPKSLWVGEIIRNGDGVYFEWKKTKQSLKYIFTQESENLFSKHSLQEVFKISSGHPPIIKEFLRDNISIETLTIYNIIFKFKKKFDLNFKDPVWETLSFKIDKYIGFLNINVTDYKIILRKIIQEE